MRAALGACDRLGGRPIAGDRLTQPAFGNSTRFRIGRLNPDGSLDAGFNPGTVSSDDRVLAIVVQADGHVLVGGFFVGIGGGTGNQIRNYIGRVANTDAAVQSLSYAGGVVTWARSGAAPEVWRVTFESSADV